jgi:hypothetical protein
MDKVNTKKERKKNILTEPGENSVTGTDMESL